MCVCLACSVQMGLRVTGSRHRISIGAARADECGLVRCHYLDLSFSRDIWSSDVAFCPNVPRWTNAR